MTEHNAMKERLEKMLAEITIELHELGIHNPEVPEDWIATPPAEGVNEADENLVADRAEEWNERNAEVAQLETRYNNIIRALRKLDAGTYGICEISNEPIEADRLEANPAARTCKAHMNEEADLSS